MSSKYPSIAFTARDAQDLMAVAEEHLSGLSIVVRSSPTKGDRDRIALVAWGFTKAHRIGDKTRAEAVVYISGKGHQSFDRAMFDVLWKLINLIESPPQLWGTYTTLVDMPKPRQ